jgi:hypothetical protein
VFLSESSKGPKQDGCEQIAVCLYGGEHGCADFQPLPQVIEDNEVQGVVSSHRKRGSIGRQLRDLQTNVGS